MAELEAPMTKPMPALHEIASPLLQDYILQAGCQYPDKVALVCMGERFTFSEINARSNALAHALVRRGIERGDRVIVFGDNTVQTVVSFWAVLKANAVVSVVNPLTKSDKLNYLLNDCRARALITDAHIASVFLPAARNAKHLTSTIVSGALDDEMKAGLPGPVHFDRAIDEESCEAPPPRFNIDIDLASIIYTSGSTGDPKGVMLTHRNMLTSATSVSTYLELAHDDVLLGVMPLAFDYGLYQLIMLNAGWRAARTRAILHLPSPGVIEHDRRKSYGVSGRSHDLHDYREYEESLDL